MAWGRGATAFLCLLCSGCRGFAAPTRHIPQLPITDSFFDAEIGYLAGLKSRRTGSEMHNRLINRICGQLEILGLEVFTETLSFDYDDVSSLLPGKLSLLGINEEPVAASSAVPYSGHTLEAGITGRLTRLTGPTSAVDWSEAADNIAVISIANPPVDAKSTLPLWPGSPPWGPPSTGIPSTIANSNITDLNRAADAGVRAIVYAWENITDELAAGLYAPFHNPWFGMPAVFVSGNSSKRVQEAAAAQMQAKLTLTGRLRQSTPTSNVWVVIRGTELPNESIILSTHTDGTNAAEENGHVALLHYAQWLTRFPPRRTTILAFITAHIHAAPFSTTKRSTTRWLADYPTLWNGSEPDGMRAVFATCVEHLGAVAYEEDLISNTYTPTGLPQEELLYASTPELTALLYNQWIGAIPNLTRIINPNVGPQAQLGEGLPLWHARIPEISLVTAPPWLLKEFPKEFDERRLVDMHALRRQVDSFERIWRMADLMPRHDFGTMAPGG